MRARLTSFDGTESFDVECLRPDRYRHLFAALKSEDPSIPRGAGLSYCAASAGPGSISVSSERFDRILGFDAQAGRITVEAGMTLGELYRFTVPRGWVLPVIPGHPSITIGGCLAFNVHGKNQHRAGNFAACVESLTLFHPDKGELVCSPQQNAEAFALTIGGFGLTGFVLSARLKLQSVAAGWFTIKRLSVGSLREASDLMANLEEGAYCLYSWHDLNGGDAGRGFVFAAYPDPAVGAGPALRYRRLDASARARLPIALLNRLTVGWSVALYFRLQGLLPERRSAGLPETTFPIFGREYYFKAFGRAGFREFQSLVPDAGWPSYESAVRALIRRHGAPIAVVSLKRFRGKRSLLNFQGDGVCLALDAPEGESTRALWRELASATLDASGIANLSKDGLLDARFAERAYPEYGAFRQRLATFDPKRRFDSSLRRRLDV